MKVRDAQNVASESRQISTRQLGSYQQRPQSSHPLTSQPLTAGPAHGDHRGQPYNRKMMLHEKFTSCHDDGTSAADAAYPSIMVNQRYYGSTQPNANDAEVRPQRIIPSRPQSSYLKNSTNSGPTGHPAQMRNSRRQIRKSGVHDEKQRSINQPPNNNEQTVQALPKKQPVTSLQFSNQITSMFQSMRDSLLTI